MKITIGLTLMLACMVARADDEAGAPKVGGAAPDFTVPASGGETVTLSALRGKWVVLYFYPKAFTPGCTSEACSLRDGHGGLEALGAAVYGISLDSVETIAKFREKYTLPFELLSDSKKAVAKAYGTLGLGGMFTKRWTYLIDPEGKVAHVFRDVNVKEHDRQVREVLEKLQAQRKPAAAP